MAHSDNVIEVHESTFEQDVIQKSHEKPVVVDFWAEWCGPCRMLGPVLERLASEPGSNFVLAKVDVDVNQGLAMRFGIQGIPAVKAFKDGQVAATGRPADLLDAENLLSDRQWKEAEEAYRELLIENPENSEAKIGLTRALIPQGKGCEAKRMLEELQGDHNLNAGTERLMPVAEYVCSVGESDDDGLELTVVEAQYRQAARLLGRGSLAPAMDGLLEVLRYNKEYRSGQAKLVLLGIFELLGDEDPLTNIYRREMASILF